MILLISTCSVPCRSAGARLLFHGGVAVNPGQQVVGIFALYAPETGFFDEEEMALLTEMAGDISFRNGSLEKRRAPQLSGFL